MKIKLYAVALTLSLLPSFGIAAIEEVKSMAQVESCFSNIEEPLKEETLGLFDVNETLTLPADAVFQRPNFRPHVEMLRKITQPLTPNQRTFFTNLLNVALPMQLIEQDAPATLQKLHQQKIKIMALSAAMTGQIGEIESEEHLYNELKRLGIDFALSFPELGELLFNDFAPFRENYPAFKRGILFTNGENFRNDDKGEILVHFFKQTGWSPKIVIAVDDKLENLQNIESALKNFQPEIKYIGLHYTRTLDIIPEVLDGALVKEQWEVWVKKAQELHK